jgi:Cu2+-exporting ATPase
MSVESMLKAAPGVQDASVNFANQSALVTYDPALIDPTGLQKTVREIGYDLVIDTVDPQAVREEEQQRKLHTLRRQSIGALILSVPVVVIGMFLMHARWSNPVSFALSLPVMIFFGRDFFIRASKQATHRQATMDTLVALSTGIAFLLSTFSTFFPSFWLERGLHPPVYFEAATVVIAFVSLGKWLEEKARSHTSSAIRKLMELQPSAVRIVDHEQEKEIAVSALQAGMIVRIRPGERIPADGAVREGSSFVNESMINGEPLPSEKIPGATVFAGTLNEKGSFTFEAKQVGKDTMLARIIGRVQGAQGSKAPVQLLVDRIAGIFVPVVIGISILTFITWMAIGGEDAFVHAVLTSVSVLVIACPCALGLATPAALIAGIGKGAENNILIKDADSLEKAHRVTAVVLDKTGTLTEGKPEVSESAWTTGVSVEKLSAILYSLEALSEHPLAAAITHYLQVKNSLHVTDFLSLTSRGVQGSVEGRRYYVGNRQLLSEKKIVRNDKLDAHARRWQAAGKTVLYFADQEQLLGVFAVSDRIRTTSAEAVRMLLKNDIEVHLITGDHAATAKAVADETGIKNFQADVLPSGKADVIRKLQREGKVVAMAGDGINDSEALAEADVSIAMGRGSDIAMEVAGITLNTSDLRAIPKALALSGKVVWNIRENLFWAFIYNLVGIPLAAGVLYPVNGFLLSPMIAGAAMALSSVSVIGNSLRLKALKL